MNLIYPIVGSDPLDKNNICLTTTLYVVLSCQSDVTINWTDWTTAITYTLVCTMIKSTLFYRESMKCWRFITFYENFNFSGSTTRKILFWPRYRPDGIVIVGTTNPILYLWYLSGGHNHKSTPDSPADIEGVIQVDGDKKLNLLIIFHYTFT